MADNDFKRVDDRLREVPPVKFDIVRQVRVFEPYLQYVELNLAGASIQKHKVQIPKSIQSFHAAKELEDRLRTTFDLIEQKSKLSSKPLEDALNDIRKDFAPSLGKGYGRVILKAAKPGLLARIAKFREALDAHQKRVASELKAKLDESRKQVVDYYLPFVQKHPPDNLLGQLTGPPKEEDVRQWIDGQLDKSFPSAESLIAEMRLEERYKDVTFETLNQPEFLVAVKKAFPLIDWDKTYDEFKAAGEARDEGI